MEITQEVAAKVLSVVDAGLVRGDEPTCVGAAVRRFKIRLNDSRAWPSDEARAKGLRRIAVAQLGSDTINQCEFATYVTIQTIKRIFPLVLRKQGFKKEAVVCEQATTLDEAHKAAVAARTKLLAATADYAAATAKEEAHSILLLSAKIGEEALVKLSSPGVKMAVPYRSGLKSLSY